jgi:hypothetical protein
MKLLARPTVAIVAPGLRFQPLVLPPQTSKGRNVPICLETSSLPQAISAALDVDPEWAGKEELVYGFEIDFHPAPRASLFYRTLDGPVGLLFVPALDEYALHIITGFRNTSLSEFTVWFRDPVADFRTASCDINIVQLFSKIGSRLRDQVILSLMEQLRDNAGARASYYCSFAEPQGSHFDCDLGAKLIGSEELQLPSPSWARGEWAKLQAWAGNPEEIILCAEFAVNAHARAEALRSRRSNH